MFVFRKLADYSSGGTRVTRFDPMTGEKILVNPETNQPEPWPLLGVTIEGEIPVKDKLGMDFVGRAVNEGWAEWMNHRTVHRPAGPEGNPWASTHTFHQADEVIFHVLLNDDGSWVKKDLFYKVTQQPDKRQVNDAWEVDWTFHLELVRVGG